MCKTSKRPALTSTGLDNTHHALQPTTNYHILLSRSPRLLDPILAQGIGIWYREDPNDCHHFPAKGLVYSPQRPTSLTSTTVGYPLFHKLLLAHASLAYSLRPVGQFFSGEHRIACLSEVVLHIAYS